MAIRTDVTIDRKQVICKNSSLLGFSTCKVRCGYFVLFKDFEALRQGRVIGRIARGFTLDEVNPASLQNYLVVVALGQRLCTTYERWVNPDDVTEAYDIRKSGSLRGTFRARALEVVEYFFNEDFEKQFIDATRAAAHEGYPTYEAYLNRHKYARDAAATLPNK